MNEYEKAVRTKVLIENGKTMGWLCEEINKTIGLKIDSSYLKKILDGRKGSVKVVGAIERVLGIPVPDGYGRGGFKG